MKNGIKYKFTATPWQQCWCFVSLPEEMANDIRKKEDIEIDKEVEVGIWL